MKGTICSWITHKGFGFILPDGVPSHGEHGDHVFLHISDCPGRKPLDVNTRIEFTIIPWGDHYKASGVKVIPADSSVGGRP